jgi:hypothetical protein
MRTVKDIPLTPTLLGFFFLLYIVCIFTYIVTSLIFVKKSNVIFEIILDIIFIPIKELDKSIKNISYIRKYYDKVLTYILPYLEILIIKTNIFYIVFWIIPRVLLLFVLFLDIFIYHKFEYRYKFLFLGLFLLFNRCFKYSLKNTKSQKFQEIAPFVREITTKYYPGVHPAELEPDYDPNDPDEDDYLPNMALPLDVFIEHHTNYVVYEGITNEMYISHSTYAFHYMQKKYLGELLPDSRKISIDNYNNKFGLSYWETYAFLYTKQEEYINPKVSLLLRISILLEYYNKTNNQIKKYKYLKILIFTGYLLCWLYILIKSTPNVPDTEWEKLVLICKNMQDKIEPFTEIKIND